MVSVRETQFSKYILEANKLGKQIILLQCSKFKKRKLTRFDSELLVFRQLISMSRKVLK